MRENSNERPSSPTANPKLNSTTDSPELLGIAAPLLGPDGMSDWLASQNKRYKDLCDEQDNIWNARLKDPTSKEALSTRDPEISAERLAIIDSMYHKVLSFSSPDHESSLAET